MSVIDIGSRAGEGLVRRSSGRFFFAAALHLTVKGNGIVRPIVDREILERFRQSLEVVGVANGNAGFVPFAKGVHREVAQSRDPRYNFPTGHTMASAKLQAHFPARAYARSPHFF